VQIARSRDGPHGPSFFFAHWTRAFAVPQAWRSCAGTVRLASADRMGRWRASRGKCARRLIVCDFVIGQPAGHPSACVVSLCMLVAGTQGLEALATHGQDARATRSAPPPPRRREGFLRGTL
jgi:hypothetical protein